MSEAAAARDSELFGAYPRKGYVGATRAEPMYLEDDAGNHDTNQMIRYGHGLGARVDYNFQDISETATHMAYKFNFVQPAPEILVTRQSQSVWGDVFNYVEDAQVLLTGFTRDPTPFTIIFGAGYPATPVDMVGESAVDVAISTTWFPVVLSELEAERVAATAEGCAEVTKLANQSAMSLLQELAKSIALAPDVYVTDEGAVAIEFRGQGSALLAICEPDGQAVIYYEIDGNPGRSRSNTVEDMIEMFLGGVIRKMGFEPA